MSWQFYELLNKTVVCYPCQAPSVGGFYPYDECQDRCAGKTTMRLLENPSLSYWDECVKVMAGLDIYIIFCFLLGIPCLWYYLILRNKRVVHLIPAFGFDLETKWRTIVSRLNTTAIFLFYQYKVAHSTWSIFLIFAKFLVMLISTIAGRVFRPVIFVLPVWYFTILILIIVSKPYIQMVNTVLDAILYGANFGVSIIPLLSYFHINLPESASLPFSIALVLVPVLSTIVIIFCEIKHKSSQKHIDPTMELTPDEFQDPDFRREQLLIIKDQLNKMPPEYKKMIAATKAYTNTLKTNLDQELTLLDHRTLTRTQPMLPTFSSYDPQNLRAKTNGYAKIESQSQFKFQLDTQENQNENDNVVDFGQKKNDKTYGVQLDVPLTFMDCIIEPGMLDSIDQMRKAQKQICPYYNNGIPFVVGRNKLIQKVKNMYDMIDRVLDGSTIEQLSNVLNILIMFGSTAFGWYIGMLMNPAKSSQFAISC